MTARIQRAGIVAKQGLAASALLTRLGDWLHGHGVTPVFESETAALAGTPRDGTFSRENLPAQVDLIVVLGGDGTLLAMADRTAQAGRDIPILGVNFGSLGFLTEIRIDELFASLEAVVNGTATYDERLMLAATASLRGKPDETRVVLNDVVFTKGALSRMIELSVSVSGRFVTCVKADGLIIASATGSTAYNLAAGGPIVHPAMDALVLTPIAPHTLTNRPIVIPAERDVRVKSTGTNAGNIYVTFDGQSGFEMSEGDEVLIARAPRPLRLVRSSSRSYFEVLRQKLKWNER